MSKANMIYVGADKRQKELVTLCTTKFGTIYCSASEAEKFRKDETIDTDCATENTNEEETSELLSSNQTASLGSLEVFGRR